VHDKNFIGKDLGHSAKALLSVMIALGTRQRKVVVTAHGTLTDALPSAPLLGAQQRIFIFLKKTLSSVPLHSTRQRIFF
jgi:hypothetical protein